MPPKMSRCPQCKDWHLRKRQQLHLKSTGYICMRCGYRWLVRGNGTIVSAPELEIPTRCPQCSSTNIAEFWDKNRKRLLRCCPSCEYNWFVYPDGSTRPAAEVVEEDLDILGIPGQPIVGY